MGVLSAVTMTAAPSFTWYTGDEVRLLNEWAAYRKWDVLRGYIRAATRYERDWGRLDPFRCVEHARALLREAGE